MPGALRVLLVDDHDLFRTGLRALLEEEGFEVGDAASGEEAVRCVRALPPDVVVMDMNMPGIGGVEATRAISEQQSAPPVLVLTVSAEDYRVLDAVVAGASGYLLKDADLEDIAAGIRAGRGLLARDSGGA